MKKYIFSIFIAALLGSAGTGHAGTPNYITSSTSITLARNSGTYNYIISDGMTLTISSANNASNNGSVYNSSIPFDVTTAGPANTGSVVFAGQSTGTAGGVFSVGSPAGTKAGGAIQVISSNTFMNATFQNYWAYGNGGAIALATGGNLMLTNANLNNNGAIYTGGAINIGASSTLTINSGTFTNNQTAGFYPVSLAGTAQSGNGGAIGMQGASIANKSQLILKNVVFSNNQAVGTSGNGGAMYIRTANVYILDPIFQNNQASGSGGAIFAPDGTVVTIDVTKDALYSGNVANGTTNGTLGAASGTAGGFLALNNTNTNVANINISSGRTLAIGSAGNVMADTFSIPSTGTLNINMAGTGSLAAGTTTGTLVLHGASTNVNGSVNIGAGTVLLGNNSAAFGGRISVSAPATFGGVGTLASGSGVIAASGATLQVGTADVPAGLLTVNSGTFLGTGNLTGSGTLAGNLSLGGALTANVTGSLQPLVVTSTLTASAPAATITKTGAGTLAFASDNSAFTNTVNVNSGGLRMDSAGILGGNVNVNSGASLLISAIAGAPTVSGTVRLNTGATIAYDNQHNAVALNVGALSVAGGNNVAITSLTSGTYTLVNSAAAITDPVGSAFTTLYKDTALAGRNTATYNIIGGNSLQMILGITSAVRTWNAGVDSNWNASAQNWVESDKLFQDGDTVVFAGAGAASPITISSAGVIASEMQVNGASNYTFAGGGITTNSTSWQGPVANTSTGKLLKAGSGTLAFTNSANNFTNGIDISGGAISFTNVAQLGTKDTASADHGINFTGNGALLAAADNMTLANTFNIGSGASATLDTQGNTLTYTGTLIGAGSTSILNKSGTGTLNLATNNGGYNGSTAINAGTVNLSGYLGGAITVNSIGILAGTGTAGGNVTANNGSRIRIGDVSATAPQNLTVTGALNLNNATVQTKIIHGATPDIPAVTDTITAGSLSLAGVNTFDFYTVLLSGSYNLINTTSGITGFNAANFVTLQAGVANIPARMDTNYSISGNNLILTVAIANRAITWNGSVNNIWDTASANWQGGDTVYSGGDSVTFDSVADNAHTSNRAISVFSTGVTVADMNVAGDGNYTFSGGAIIGTTDPTKSTIGSGSGGPTGRLNKNGIGTLTLNNGANNFAGGIYVNIGTLAGNATSLATNTINVASPATLIISQTSTGDFAGVAIGDGTTIKSGSSALRLASTGTIGTRTFNINQGTFYEGAGTVKVGTLNINSGAKMIYGGGSLKADTLNINASGTFHAPASLTINAATLNHAGDIAIGTAVNSSLAHQTLTLSGNYVGQGGTLDLDTILATGVTDQLAITGNASGNTLVSISHPAGEQGAPTSGQGIKIIGIGGADTLDVELAHRLNAGIYDYQIYHDTGGIFLRSEISSEILATNSVPAVAMYAGRASLDTLQNRLGEIRLNPERNAGLWVRDTYRSDALQKSWFSDLTIDTNVIQVGADKAFIHPNGTPDNWVLGAYYTRTEGRGTYSSQSGKVDSNANGGGVYAIFKRGDFYIEALGKADFNNNKCTAAYGYQQSNGTIIGGSLEAGYELALGELGTLEPQAQVSYQYIKVDSGYDNQGRFYSFENFNAASVRAGMRWHKDFKFGPKSAFIPWLRGSAVYDCKNEYATTVVDTLGVTHIFDNDLAGARYIVDLGATLQMGDRWSLYASGGYETGPKIESWTASGGIRFAW